MALRFIDGFEHYTIPADLSQKWTSYNQSTKSTPFGSTTGRRADSNALRIRNDQDWVSITLDSLKSYVFVPQLLAVLMKKYETVHLRVDEK
jgi:hypothetical protein